MPSQERGPGPEAAQETPRDQALGYIERQELRFAKLPDGDIKYEQVGRLSNLRKAVEGGDEDAIAWTVRDKQVDEENHREYLKEYRHKLQRDLDGELVRRTKLEEEVRKGREYIGKLEERLRDPSKQPKHPGPLPKNTEYGSDDWSGYQDALAEYQQALHQDQDEFEFELFMHRNSEIDLQRSEEDIDMLRRQIQIEDEIEKERNG